MLCHVNTVEERLACWAEACKCHFTLALTPTKGFFKKLNIVQDFANLHDTRCRQKRQKTPELAAGYVKKIVSDFMAATKRRLLKVCNRLSPVEREIVMGNFSKGSLHMEYIITLKLAIWDNLPH